MIAFKQSTMIKQDEEDSVDLTKGILSETGLEMSDTLLTPTLTHP